MNHNELELIFELCKKHRVTRFKADEFEFELELPPTEEQLKAATDMAAIMSQHKEVSDEEILFDPMAGLSNADNQ